MNIGGIEIRGAALAPMAGFTDVGFRDVCAMYGAGITYTEMVSAKGMVYGNEKTRELLAVSDTEKIRAAQIFGNDPYIMADAVQHPELTKFDIIDINMGCPVPKIVKNGEGSALLNNFQLAYQIIKSVTAATTKPVTVKMRIGFKTGEFNAVSLAQAVEAGGAAAIAVHGRTREQYYSGEVDREAIRKVKEAVGIPVIANGDIESYADCVAMSAATGADGVMIGRGALGKPWVFAAMTAPLSDVMTVKPDVREIIMRQINTLKNFYNDRYIYSNMKKHICYYARGIAGVKHIRDAACRVESVEEMIDIVMATDWTKETK